MKVHRLNLAYSNTRPSSRQFLSLHAVLNKLLGVKPLDESTRQIIVDRSQCNFIVAVQSRFYPFEDAYRTHN